MAINFFEGGRRIAKLLAALWATGVVAVFASDGLPSVGTVFVVESPGTTPIRTDSECTFNDAIEYDYPRKTARGTDY